jgi:uncharacterized protein (DUF58 family)
MATQTATQAKAEEVLDPSTLSGIDNLQLVAKVAVDGFLSGMHRSLYHGHGSEFFQYRTYAPGDDLKYVDWKVFSRHDRFYTKLFEEETNMNVTLVADMSASMNYRGENSPATKWRYAAMTAAALAYLVRKQGDNLGLFLYGQELVEGLAPSHRSGQFRRVINALQTAQPAGAETAHEEMFNYLAKHGGRRGIVVLISDMLGGEEALPPLFSLLRSQGHDCIAIQVLDPDEIDFPFDQPLEFIDLEDGQRIRTNGAEIRTEYQQNMNQFLTQLSGGIIRTGTDYLRLRTTDSLGKALAQFLQTRGRK